jgi:drug/metabolite transporter (DMT)-like permease
MGHITAVLAIVLLGERLASYHVVGGVAAVLGVLVSQSMRKLLRMPRVLDGKSA